MIIKDLPKSILSIHLFNYIYKKEIGKNVKMEVSKCKKNKK